MSFPQGMRVLFVGTGLAILGVVFWAGIEAGNVRNLDGRVTVLEQNTRTIPAQLASIKEMLHFQGEEIHQINHRLETHHAYYRRRK